jgi:GTPase SAR1 family protein
MYQTQLEIFQTAYKNLELTPLITKEKSDKFAVPCNPDIIEELEQLIEDASPNNYKIIFSGHRGCGKSTLLAELKRRLEDRFFVVFFSISDMIEMSDVNHVNILFAMAISLMEEAENKHIEIKDSIKDKFYNWFAQKTRTEINEFKAELETGFNFTNLLAWIKGVLRTNSTIRDEIKNEYERKISDLVARINEIAIVIESVSQRKILVIIDDLDKLDLAKVNDIFAGNIKALFSPQFRTLMTIPIAALREVSLRGILVAETNNQLVSMPVYKLLPQRENRQENNTPNQENLQVLTKILQKRIPLNLIESAIITEIVIYSGGVLRELMRIANECCRICLRLIRRQSNDDARTFIINREIFKQAINKLRLDFETPIGQADYIILQSIYDNYQPPDPKEDKFLDLLHSLYILEYRNGKIWYDLHPIVEKLMLNRANQE